MPVIWITLGFFAGLVVADNFLWPLTVWIVLAGSSSLLLMSRFLFYRWQKDKSPKTPYPALILSTILFFALGASYYKISRPDLTDPNFIASHTDTGKPMVVVGVVSDFPDVRDNYVNLRVRVEELHPAGEFIHTAVQGLLLAKIPPESDIHYGDQVVLRGLLNTPPTAEDFSYREYLARQEIYAYMPRTKISLLESGHGNPLLRIIYALKEKSLATIYRLWPDPEASLFAGILLGIESGIPVHVKQAFTNTGTSHIIAISGFNITIIAGLFATFFSRILNPRQGAIAATVGITLYTILVGADAAVLRAAIMGGLTLFAQQIGRRQSGLNAIAAASFFMAVFNPQLPWDISFQLSLAATLGLILYADPLQQGFVKIAARYIPYKRAKRLSQPVGEYILFTFAAQLTTFPITIYHFHRLSLTSFLTNPIILPVQPPIMTIGGLAVILGLIWLPLGKLIAPIIWPFTLFTIRVVEFFGKYQGGVLVFKDVGLLSVVLLFGVLFLWTFARNRLKSVVAILKPVTVLTALGIVTVLIWRGVFAAPDGRLHLTMLNVGNGESLLIQTPQGKNILINGGASTSLLSDGLGRRFPPLQHTIDALIIASPEEKQIAALSRTLDRFTPSQVLWAGAPSPCREADYLRSALIERNIPLTEAEPGHRLELGEDIYLTVLTVSKQGAILSLEWENFRALLPFGVTKETFKELRMGKNIGEVNILMLADNGYEPSNPPSWITNLHPQLLLLGVAPDNPQGLPNRDLLDRLGGYSLARTDQHGWISIATDGKNMWLTMEKQHESGGE